MALGDIYNNGNTQLIVGSIAGGIQVLDLAGGANIQEVELIAFPNPAKRDQTLNIFSSADQQLIITDMAGKIIYDPFHIQQQTSVEIQIDGLLPGLYLVKGTKSNSKFFIDE